jgi:excisionase family DNA binding protein
VSDYLTTAEIAAELKISVSNATRMARDGRLVAIKVGKLWRFPKQSTEILYAKQAQEMRRKQMDDAKSGKTKARNGLKEFLKLAADIGSSDSIRNG